MEVTFPKENLTPFPGSMPQKMQNHQDPHLVAFPLKILTSSVMKFTTFHIKQMWLLVLLCRI